jgi:hypothetical protein
VHPPCHASEANDLSKPFMANETNNTVEQPAIRDILFGDLPFSQWPDDASTSVDGEPWHSFISARNQLDSGNQESARAKLRQILQTPDLESRHYLQAWHFLRQLGQAPADGDGKHLYGVVVEVALEDGLDIVAAYADHTARYLNFSGAAIVWERPDESLDAAIDSLLAAGRMVAAQIGPHEGPRPPAPPSGQVRISMLVPSGLHFGQGPFEALSGDPLGGPVIAAAMQLMQSLITRTETSTT